VSGKDAMMAVAWVSHQAQSERRRQGGGEGECVLVVVGGEAPISRHFVVDVGSGSGSGSGSSSGSAAAAPSVANETGAGLFGELASYSSHWRFNIFLKRLYLHAPVQRGCQLSSERQRTSALDEMCQLREPSSSQNFQGDWWWWWWWLRWLLAPVHELVEVDGAIVVLV
jgi:hypothetical protein